MPQHEKQVVTIEQLIGKKLEEWALYPHDGKRDTIPSDLRLRRGRVEYDETRVKFPDVAPHTDE